MKKIILFIAISCLYFVTDNQATTKVEEAFVAYATQSYFPLLKILLDSLKEFSRKPIIVYSLNTDLPFNSNQYPLLIARRIDVDLTRFYPWCYKSLILYESNVSYGIYLDADMVASPGIDILFDLCRYAEQYPLSPIHPDNVNDDKICRLMQNMQVKKKSMPYVHDNIIIFSDKCYDFLLEWHRCCLQYAFITPEDEKVLNSLLWKHNARHYLTPIEFYWTRIDEIPKNSIIAPDALLNSFDQSSNPETDYYRLHAQYPLLFHGCKSPDNAQLLLTYIKRKFFRS